MAQPENAAETTVQTPPATSDANPAGAASTEAILAYLAEKPDIDSLLTAFPGLTIEEVRATFASAAATAAGPPMIRRKKGVNQTTMLKSHGLPEADGSLNKGHVFRAILEPFKTGKLLDLGAGKGNFALEAARMGWQVTAVDARTMRWPDLDEERDPETADLIRAITWVQADVREFPIERGEYDVICILGLLHHLEVPDQVDLLRRCAGTPLLIDARIAPSNVDRYEDYEGWLIHEHGETREERDQVATAAWGNATSFRHTEESLVRLARNSGYPLVMQARPPHRREYTFYLCLPRPLGLPERRGKGKGKRARQAGESGVTQ